MSNTCPKIAQEIIEERFQRQFVTFLGVLIFGRFGHCFHLVILFSARPLQLKRHLCALLPFMNDMQGLTSFHLPLLLLHVLLYGHCQALF